MSDPTNPNIKNRNTPQSGLYQRENFQKVNQGQIPLFDTGEPPFAIRGVQRVKDAKKCVELRVDVIVVSSLAGGQIYGAVASLEAQKEVFEVEVAGEKTYIVFDSGVTGAVHLGIEYDGEGWGETCHEELVGGLEYVDGCCWVYFGGEFILTKRFLSRVQSLTRWPEKVLRWS
ncbi:FMN-linked oxidoreductase [Penicillium sp. IBT 18751x]|nr:FMN-linked oxidoreductase [Penicillium sp. IBT 18751x]